MYSTKIHFLGIVIDIVEQSFFDMMLVLSGLIFIFIEKVLGMLSMFVIFRQTTYPSGTTITVLPEF